MEQHLSKQQESFCDNAGLVGVLISIACLIQYMIFMVPGWITVVIILVYILCITGFVLLMKKNAAAPLLLLLSAVLTFLVEILMMLSLAFSLVLVLLLLYLCAVTAVVYIDETAAQLKKRSIALKQDAAAWDNVL